MTDSGHGNVTSWDDFLLRATRLQEPIQLAGIEFEEALKMLQSSKSVSQTGLSLARIGQRIWNSTSSWPDLARSETANRARVFIESGLILESEQGEMWRTLGELCHFQGEHSRAVEAYGRYLEENPRNVASRAEMASSMFRMTRFESAYREARRVIDEADSTVDSDRWAKELAERILAGK